MRKPVCYILPLIGLAMLLAGCTDEEVGGEGQMQEEMRLYSSMDGRTEGSEEETSDEETSSATSTAGQAVFLFWDFGDVLSGTETPTPLYVKNPDKDIDTYKRPNEPYNTGELYPDGNRRVMATGYAPSTLTPDGTDNYEVLTIPDGYGTTDILTSVEPIVASAALPFDREGGETLQFMHAQSKVNFEAKLAENMGKFIQNVRITLGGDLIATQVCWDKGKEMYVPKVTGEKKEYTVYRKQGEGDTDYQLTKENPLEIGSVYIVPEKTKLAVTLTVERAEEVNASEWETITFQATLPFTIERDATKDWDKGKEVNTLYANEAYKFTIAFGEEGIELVGKKCPWENGGYLIIPIYPLGDTTHRSNLNRSFDR